MGKSDIFVFDDYKRMTQHLRPKNVAFLGFSVPNAFSNSFLDCKKDFYDIALGNWNINSQWTLNDTYDLIVSTRCPYFAKDPTDFVSRCKSHLNVNGKVFIDWGLGDHWRFKNYKVGWVRNGEHEWAYFEGNFLHSCMWRREFAEHHVVQDFWDAVLLLKEAGYNVQYDDIDTVVRREVPSITDYDFEKINFRFLWPEQPQLYIMTLL